MRTNQRPPAQRSLFGVGDALAVAQGFDQPQPALRRWMWGPRNSRAVLSRSTSSGGGRPQAARVSGAASNGRFFREPVGAASHFGVAAMSGALFGGSRSAQRHRAQCGQARGSSEHRVRKPCVLRGNHLTHRVTCGVESKAGSCAPRRKQRVIFGRPCAEHEVFRDATRRHGEFFGTHRDNVGAAKLAT